MFIQKWPLQIAEFICSNRPMCHISTKLSFDQLNIHLSRENIKTLSYKMYLKKHVKGYTGKVRSCILYFAHPWREILDYSNMDSLYSQCRFISFTWEVGFPLSGMTVQFTMVPLSSWCRVLVIWTVYLKDRSSFSFIKEKLVTLPHAIVNASGSIFGNKRLISHTIVTVFPTAKLFLPTAVNVMFGFTATHQIV